MGKDFPLDADISKFKSKMLPIAIQNPNILPTSAADEPIITC